ncbi:hypothetical protein AnigIFM50267_008075 [Aspergillus niger]|nr:hypothetical protein AnigIFM50267_008075 [Aspergillus niger]
MTDLTPTFSELLRSKSPSSKLSTGYMTTEIADEFLKEAYRINNHITSLLSYLHTIRPSYLSLTTKPTTQHTKQHQHQQQPEILDDTARDTITTTTSTLLSNLSTSITTLSAAENLRQETVSRSITQRFGKGLLAKWAGGATLTSGNNDEGKEEEQVVEEEKEKVLKWVRESVLFYLRIKLGGVVNEQRDMVEKRIERVRERERSVLYKSSGGGKGGWGSVDGGSWRGDAAGGGTTGSVMMDESEVKEIEKQLTPQQLQLFEEENDSMVKYFEDVVGKVQ